jgi:DsbC/DsbD-like thiol-disulfide interchange protein
VGEAVEALIRLRIESGWSVPAHRPGARDLAGLTVSVATPGITVSPPRYPEADAAPHAFASRPVAVHSGEALVTLPVAVKLRPRAAALRVRFRVGFQACRGRSCRPPETVLVEVPSEVLP